ncbi:AsmA-like C-terminal region-containing protein [Bacteroidota bacterium]
MGNLNRVFIYLFLFIGIILSLTAWYVYSNQDEIINKVVDEINQYIDTPVEAEEIDLSMFREFPSITLRLRNIKIHQSTEVLNDYLCIASDIFVSIRLMDILKENISIEKVTVSGAVINLARSNDGIPNYLILTRKDSTSISTRGSFDIKNLSLSEVEINYTDFRNDVSVRAMADHQMMNLQYKKGDILLHTEGNMELKSLNIEDNRFLENTSIEEDIKLTYTPDTEELIITEANAYLNGFPYVITGNVQMVEMPIVEFDFKSSQSDIQSIISLLPEDYRNYLWPYKSKGAVYFNGRIHGYAGKNTYPSIELKFGAKDASVYHPDYRTTIDHLFFTGSYNNGEDQNLKTSVLDIKDIKGQVKGKGMSGRLTLKDFNQLKLDADITSEFDLPAFLEVFPTELIKTSRGQVNLNLNFNGPVKDIENNIRSNLVKVSGDMIMSDVSVITRRPVLSFNNLNGHFIFNNHDLAIEDFIGKIGASDFHINGFFKNVIAWLFVKNYPVRIDATMQSKNIDLNELLSIDFDTSSSVQPGSSQYYFNISDRLDINFNTRIENVYFERFHGRNILADLTVQNQIAIVDKMHMEAMGGELELSGSVMSRDRQMREVLVDGRINDLRIDSIFYVFKDFKQDFLKTEHLYGNISADVNTYVLLDKQLQFYPEALKVHADASIGNGQLNNFEPMQTLKQYVKKRDDLSRLRFGDLHNEIEVNNRVIYIPEMRVESNVSKLYISGTHTFDHEIDYHFHIPIIQKEKSDADEKFGIVEKDERDGASIFLKMTGTTDQYDVSYDTKAVKTKIKEDIKKEGQELREALSKKDTADFEGIELDDEYIDY